MRYQRIALLTWSTAVLLTGLPHAQSDAAAVYRWVDAGGITHYSSSPPGSPQGEVRTIDLPDAIPPESGQDDDYFSVVNQARRMEQARRAREQERFERRMAQQRLRLNRALVEAQRPAQQAPESGRVGVVWSPAYYRPHWPSRPGGRPCYRGSCLGKPPGHRPRPPVLRPPLQTRPSHPHRPPLTASVPVRR